MQKRFRVSLVLVACLASASFFGFGGTAPRVAHAESRHRTFTAPAVDASNPGEAWFVSPMRISEEKATSFLAVSRKTSYAKIGVDAPEMAAAVRAALGQAKARPMGGLTMIYHGELAFAPDAPLDVDAGLPVAAGAVDAGDATVRELPAFKCACVAFGGPVSAMGQAYKDLLGDMMAAGLEPTDQRREVYVRFNGPDAGDNIVLIEIGIK